MDDGLSPIAAEAETGTWRDGYGTRKFIAYDVSGDL